MTAAKAKATKQKVKVESESGLTRVAITKRDAANKYYDKSFSKNKELGLAFYNQLLADGMKPLEAGNVCRRELHMLGDRRLREMLPDDAKHQNMKRLPNKIKQQESEQESELKSESEPEQYGRLTIL